MSLRGGARKAATWVLAASLLLSAAGVAYVATDPPHPTEPQVELFALHDGEPRDFQVQLEPGETGTLTANVVSHERRAVTYTVVATFGDEELVTATPTLDRGQSWREQIDYGADDPGQYDLSIRLYRGESATGDPVGTIRLGVTVGAGAGDADDEDPVDGNDGGNEDIDDEANVDENDGDADDADEPDANEDDGNDADGNADEDEEDDGDDEDDEDDEDNE